MNIKVDDLVITKMLVLDCDYNYNKLNEPSVRLYGKIVGTEDEGEDIILHVLGMEPYFYLGNTDINVFDLKKMVETVAKGFVKRVEIVKRYKPIGYQTEKSNMLRIVLFNPKVTPDVRTTLKERIPGITDSNLYEADIVFKYRYMVDAGISGMDIIQFSGEKIPNYGINISNDNIYICDRKDIHVLKDEVIKLEY